MHKSYICIYNTHTDSLLLNFLVFPNNMMAGLTSLEQDIFLHIVPYIGGGPSALLQLGLVNKFFGQRPTQDEPSLVEALAREMVGTHSC